jgi:hypothetical protein
MTVGKFSVGAAAVMILAAVAASQTSTSVAYEYAKIAYPGALLTLPQAINNDKVVAGSYFDSADNVHGFLYRRDKFTSVDLPGATATEVMGINDRGDIVGVYQLPGPLSFHGFLRHDGQFITIDDPAAQFGTTAFGINNAGTVVGSYDNAHGFIYENGVFRTYDAPQAPGESPNTQLNGINNLGWISGQVFTGGIWRGFWIIGEELNFLERPKNRDSQVTGMNVRGDVVGCHDANAGFISFSAKRKERSEGAPETFPVQQALASCVTAINYARLVVGSFFTVKRPFGFMAIPVLTLTVGRPDLSPQRNPVRILATASGVNPIAQIQVWVNSKRVFDVKESTLNRAVNLPVGTNQRLVIKAVDSKHVTTTIARTITVY